MTMLCPPPMGMKGDPLMIKLLRQEQMLGEVYSIHFRDLFGKSLDPNAPSPRQRWDLSVLIL